jgi:PAS domain S-box-containing protein
MNSKRIPSKTSDYAIALACVVLAIAIRLLLNPWLGERSPFATVVLTVLFITWYAGRGPALLAMAVGAIVIPWLLQKPGTPSLFTDAQQFASYLMFLIVCGSLAFMGGEMRNAKRTAQSLLGDVISQREKIRTTLTSIGDAVIVTDSRGRVESLNPIAEQLTGWTSSAASGQPLERVFVIVNERTRKPVENPVNRVLSEGIIVGLANHTILISKDGSERPIDDSAAPIRNEAGELEGAVLVFRDVTERKRNEESSRQLAAIVESSDDAIIGKSLHGTITSWNAGAKRLYGYDAAEIVGKSMSVLVPDDRADEVEQSIKRIHRGERLEHFETVRIRKDGSRIEVSVSYSPIRDSHGELIGTAVTTRDLSERKKSQQVLLREAEHTETLYRIGTALTGELELKNIVQTVTDEATRLSGAQFGAFFYNTTNDRGESYTLYTISGVEPQLFAMFPMPRNTAIFEPTFRGQGIVRIDDVTKDPRYGKNAPHKGMPPGHLPVRSYLAVPVVSNSGEVHGGLFFGHPDAGVFTERHERLVEGIAVQAAIAVDNSNLYRRLQDSEERFRQLAEHIGDVFWLRKAPDRSILYVSPAYEEVWGKSLETLYADGASFSYSIHPEDRDKVLKIQDLQDRGEPTSIEYRVIRPDGSVRWVWDRGFPVRDESGKVYRVAGIAEDITSRKFQEQDTKFLADASATLSTLIDHESTLQKVATLAVPFFSDWATVDIQDEEGQLRRVAVAHVDRQKIQLAYDVHRRFPPSPEAPQGVWKVLNSGEAELAPEITDEMLAQGIQDPELLEIIRQLGLRSYMAVPLRARGQVFGVLTFISAESGRRYTNRDLQLAEDLAHRAGVAVENSRLYQELRQADRRKDEFLSLLAHELRNPLAPIRTGLQVIRQSGNDPAFVEPAVEMMDRQVEHLIRLVDDLLDLSRIMRNKVELRREPVDLAVAVARAVETLQPVMSEAGHEVSLELSHERLLVDGDLVRLSQVIGNLLNNAARYTERGGKIVVRTSRVEDKAVLSVRDTGIGISAGMLPKIWEIFVQGESGAKVSPGGLGIGLTLVKSLVELHGGAVTAHSEGLGQGSEFVVSLPLAEKTSRPDAAASSKPQRPVARQILVVDDNVDAATTLAMLLRLNGHQVRVAHDGEQALNLAVAQPPEIAFLDIGMPQMDGFELARRFRQNPGIAGTTLVALTGWGQDADRRRTREAGFDHHFVKPIDTDSLTTLLNSV